MARRKILVVDDDTSVRELLEKAFRQAGYAVLSAASGHEALALLAREPVPVMFLDLNMPRMTGIELCRLIREIYPVACIYAMTGYGSTFELLKCREAGFDDYFHKPIELDTLFKAAKEAFEKIDRWTT